MNELFAVQSPLPTHTQRTATFITALGAIALLLLSNASGVLAGDVPVDLDVCTMTNAASGNELVCFQHDTGGDLIPAAIFSTGGQGTSGPLGNQGALAVHEDGQILLVVNAGSNSVSSFHRDAAGWTLMSVVDSQGYTPVSVTVHGNLAYVLNGAGTIAGFRLNPMTGSLSFLPESVKYLSANITSPAQISFNPAGTMLVVTEKPTNKIDTFTVGSDGIAVGPVINESIGQTPFGFAYAPNGAVIVSEAFGGMASALSSYAFTPTGQLLPVSSSIYAPEQAAACWVALSEDGMIAYTTNTETNSVSSYAVGADGSLTLLQSVASETGGAPIDLAVDEGYIYVLTGRDHSIEVYTAGESGTIDRMMSIDVPMGSNGLVAL